MIVATHLCKMIHHMRYSVNISQNQHPSLLLLLLSLNKYVSTTTNQHSFTVSYLINSCGLSSESALSASKYVHFETPDKPDSVINLFKNHGFSKSQISVLARRKPILLSLSGKILLPKIDFFYSKGISSIDITKFLCRCPTVLTCSLKDQIIPCFDYLKGLLHSDDKVIIAIKRFADILTKDPQSYIEPSIAILKQYGVPDSKIMYLLTHQPRTLAVKDGFKEVVEEVKKMGINPGRFSFIMAVNVKRGLSKSTWEKKFDVYRRWGWSEEEISLAFAKHPGCMMHSEDKIMAVMDTFVNKLGWESSYIAQHPNLLSFSLEKRIVPRCYVIQVLLSKGLINRVGFATPLMPSEKLFLERYVTRYEDPAPHLMKLYQEKMDLSNK